jgi:hypothetical protein
VGLRKSQNWTCFGWLHLQKNIFKYCRNKFKDANSKNQKRKKGKK